MATAADIVVTAPDSTEVKLVIETKLRFTAAVDAEDQLKQYMWLVRCPLGLLVSPERMRVYRDTYTSPSPATIERIGEYDTRAAIDFHPREGSQGASAALDFEVAVQTWIDSLVQGKFNILSVKDPELRKVLAEAILPAIQFGIVSAAGPRSVHHR